MGLHFFLCNNSILLKSIVFPALNHILLIEIEIVTIEGHCLGGYLVDDVVDIIHPILL